MIVGLNPYRGPLPKLCPYTPGAGIPGTPGVPAAASGTVAELVQPPPGAAAPAWFTTWVAAVQLSGTDNRPTNAARLSPVTTLLTPAGAGAGADVEANAGKLKWPLSGGEITGSPPACNELRSAIAPVIAGVIRSGLTYPAEVKPLTSEELRKIP